MSGMHRSCACILSHAHDMRIVVNVKRTIFYCEGQATTWRTHRQTLHFNCLGPVHTNVWHARCMHSGACGACICVRGPNKEPSVGHLRAASPHRGHSVADRQNKSTHMHHRRTHASHNPRRSRTRLDEHAIMMRKSSPVCARQLDDSAGRELGGLVFWQLVPHVGRSIGRLRRAVAH